jgi:hypothetical protein
MSPWGLGLTAVGLLVGGGALLASVAGSLAIYQTTMVGGSGVSNDTIALVVGGMAGGTLLTTIGLLLLAT